MTKTIRIALGSVLVCFGLSGCGEITQPTDLDGSILALAKGQPKVMICHKGETISVGGPALRAHLAHGDSEGACDACFAPGLLSWWPGNGAANDVVGGNHGVLQAGATYAVGKIGQAFSFDGINDRFAAPTIGLPTGSADRTLMFWTRSPHMDRGNRFMAGWGGPGNTHMSAILLGQFDAPTGEPFFWGWGLPSDLVAGATLDNDLWYHLAVTVAGGGLVKFYINGTETASAFKILDTSTGTTFYMGNFIFNFIHAFEGLIDEVQVYGRALSDAEIAAIVNAGNAGVCAP